MPVGDPFRDDAGGAAAMLMPCSSMRSLSSSSHPGADLSCNKTATDIFKQYRGELHGCFNMPASPAQDAILGIPLLPGRRLRETQSSSQPGHAGGFLMKFAAAYLGLLDHYMQAMTFKGEMSTIRAF